MIVLRGSYQEGNFGDDCLLVAIELFFRRLNLTDLCSIDGGRPALPKGLTDEFHLFHPDMWPSVQLIVYGGGTQFFDFGVSDSSVLRHDSRAIGFARYVIGLIGNRRLRREFAMRMNYEKSIPRIGLGVGFGPFKEGRCSDAVSALIGGMQYAWVRDKASRDVALQEGCSNVILGTDLCFTPDFRSLLNLDGLPCGHSSSGQSAPIVGVILRDWNFGGGIYQPDKWIDLSRKIREIGWEPLFLVFSKSDHSLIRKLRLNGEDLVVWDPEHMDIARFAGLISKCRIVLTARFHGAVFAALSGVPFVGIDIDPKIKMFVDGYPNCAVLLSPSPSFNELALALSSLTSPDRRAEEQIRVLSDENTRIAGTCAQAAGEYIKKIYK